jgi:hypothetical protein
VIARQRCNVHAPPISFLPPRPRDRSWRLSGALCEIARPTSALTVIFSLRMSSLELDCFV